MSRHGYSEDCDDQWALIRWRGQVASAIRGKRGQEFLRDLVAALDAMPQKRLIAKELRKDGEVCALGALGVKRGIPLEQIDPEDSELVAANFNVAEQLAREVVYQNDEECDRMTPEERWKQMHTWATGKIKSNTKEAS